MANQKNDFALWGGTVIDGLGGLHEGKAVMVSGGKIAGLCASDSLPEHFTKVDVTGKYVMPGLIEMHGHFYGRALAEMKSQHAAYCPLFLAGGITTVRTPGEFEPDVTIDIKNRIEAGTAIGPRIVSAGSYFDREPSIVGWIEGSDSIEALKEKYMKWRGKIDFVKAYSNMPSEWVKVLSDLAHADGLKVYGHLGSSTTADAILAGIDGIEHGIYTMSEFYGGASSSRANEALVDFNPDSDAASRVVELIVKNDLSVTPTTITFMLGGPGYEKRLDELSLWDYLTPEAQVFQKEKRAVFNDPKEVDIQDILVEKQYRFINRIYKAGGRVFCGTDPSYVMITPGYAIVWEAEHLEKCGMSNTDIIKALTSEAAKETGIFGTTGSLEAGKATDIIVLKDNPLSSASNLSTVETIYKSGVKHDPKTLRASALGKMA